MLALLRSLGLQCGSCFHTKKLVRIDQSNVLTLMQLHKAQQMTRGFGGAGRVKCREGLLDSGANQEKHGLRLGLRREDGNTKPVANRDQAGDSLLNVFQKPSRRIIYQGNKEVVKESKGHGLHNIIVRIQQKRTWPGQMNEKAFVKKGLLELLLVLVKKQCRKSSQPKDHLVLCQHA